MPMGRLIALPMFALLLMVLAGGLSQADAQTNAWTTVGSAGTVDEDDTGLVGFSGAVVSLKTDATGTLNIRYNVVGVAGLFGGDGLFMLVRFRDSGGGRVIARLKRYDLTTGVTTTRLTMDSNDATPAEGFQNREEADCGGSPSFFDAAWFVDVEITKGSLATNPALAALRVGLSIC